MIESRIVFWFGKELLEGKAPTKQIHNKLKNSHNMQTNKKHEKNQRVGGAGTTYSFIKIQIWTHATHVQTYKVQQARKKIRVKNENWHRTSGSKIVVSSICVHRYDRWQLHFDNSYVNIESMHIKYQLHNILTWS